MAYEIAGSGYVKFYKTHSIAIYQGVFGEYPNLTNLVVNANFLYLSSRPTGRRGQTLVFDISDPARPIEVKTTLPGGLLAVFGEYAYLSSWNKLEIWNISDVSIPFQVAQIELTGTPREVEVLDNYFYVAIPEEGFYIFDMAAPGSPVEIGAYATIQSVSGAAVAGNKAYLTSYGRLQIVDFTDPNQLVKTGSLSARIEDVFVVDGTAYLAVGENGLWIADLSQPETPRVAMYTPIDFYTEAVAVSERYAYLLSSPGELRIIDLSDPATLVQAGTYERPELTFYAVVVYDGYAYISMGGEQLLVLDVSNPANPFEVTHYEGINPFAELAISNGYLFSLGGDSLKVFEIMQPGSLKEIGTYQLPNYGNHLAVDSDKIYIIDVNGGMRVFRFVSPRSSN